MDARHLPKGAPSIESQGDGRPVNRPGVYYHQEADRFMKTAELKPGHIQADAAYQIGFRPATDEQVRDFNAKQEGQAKLNRIEESRTTTVLSSNKRGETTKE